MTVEFFCRTADACLPKSGSMNCKILFRNEYIIAAEKPQGFACEPMEKDPDCLIDEIRRELEPEAALCHRLDRNTGGIVLVGKDSSVAELIEQAQKDNRIRKTYAAVLVGNAFLRFGDGTRFVSLKAYHFKDSKLGMVYIYDQPRKLARQIETKVRPVCYDQAAGTTLCEVELVTGRTHQIRAHLAHLGYPVAGDGKYGRNAANKKLGYRYQALWAKRIEFEKKLAGKLGVPSVIESEPDFIKNQIKKN